MPWLHIPQVDQNLHLGTFARSLATIYIFAQACIIGTLVPFVRQGISRNSYYIKKIRQSSCLTESKIPVKQPNCRIFPLYSICLHILIKLHRDPPAYQSMPDDLPCFQRLFHIDDPLVLRTAECQCHAVELLNKLAVHEDIDQA